MSNEDKLEKKRKKLERKEKEKEFEKRLGDNPKALKYQSKPKQLFWLIVTLFIIFYGFDIFLFLVSFLQ